MLGIRGVTESRATNCKYFSATDFKKAVSQHAFNVPCKGTLFPFQLLRAESFLFGEGERGAGQHDA